MTDLVDLLNQSNYVFYFLIVDNSLDINLYPSLQDFHLIYAYTPANLSTLTDSHAPYFCLEEQKINLPEKNSGRLLSHPLVKNYIKETSKDKQVVIIPFKPSAKIDLICQQNHWITASNPSKINRLLEDKIKFFHICEQNSIPIIPAAIDNFNQSNFQKYQHTFGNKLIVQTHFGWAGKSTHSFDSWNQASKKIPIDTLVKYSPFLQGYTLLNNCCLTHLGLIQSPPALQYTGLSPFTNNPFATVGRQWPSFAPLKVISKVKTITQKLSIVLSNLSYKGYFGLDFFVHNNQVFLLECNPRLTASFAFYTNLEISQKWTPLFYFHLAEFLNLNYKFDIEKETIRFLDQKIIGSEITQKNNQGVTIKKYHSSKPLSSQTQPIVLDPKLMKQLIK